MRASEACRISHEQRLITITSEVGVTFGLWATRICELCYWQAQLVGAEATTRPNHSPNIGGRVDLRVSHMCRGPCE